MISGSIAAGYAQACGSRFLAGRTINHQEELTRPESFCVPRPAKVVWHYSITMFFSVQLPHGSSMEEDKEF